VELPFNLTASEKLIYASFYFVNFENFGGFGGSAHAWPLSKQFQGMINIPSYTKEGTYNLSSFYYSWGNSWGNPSGPETANFYGDSIPAAFKNISITIVNPFSDITPPVVYSLTLLSNEVNVSNSSAKIRYRIQISDEMSGLSHLNLIFRHVDYAQSISGISSGDLMAWGSLVAVDGNFKTYEGTIEVPQGSAEGDWNLDSIDLFDNAGNRELYDDELFGAKPLTPELQAVKFQVTSTAINSSEPQDKYFPWPIALTLEKTSVDVSIANQKVKVQITIKNDDLPMNEPRISIHFNMIDGFRESIIVSDFQLVSGTVAQGIYEGELVIPKYTQNGNFTVSEIYIDEQNPTGDGKSYRRWVDSIPAEFRKTITVTGTQDVTAPVLQSILVSPTSTDTRNGTILVTANLTITDDLSGLQEAEYSRGGALALRSPSGKEFLWSEFTSDDRMSGNSTNGTYQVQFDLPQYSEEGAWTIDYIELVDRNYNTRFLIPANLTAQQIAASTIQVQGWPRTWEQQSYSAAASTKGNATIQLSNLSFTYDGAEKVPTIATTPGNLTQNVTLTYNGTTTPPIDAGTYTIVAFMNHPDYKGQQVAEMTVSNPPPPAPVGGGGGGAPSGGGGGSEPEKPKKGKKGSSKKDSAKSASSKKSSNNKSEKKSTSSGSSKKSGGKKAKKK
jgi:hypothetical protein